MPRPSARRTYETDRIRVHWDSAKCIHTARCLIALPEVFDVRRRPWVDLEGADADAVARAVERCPTGALLYERRDAAAGEEPVRPAVCAAIDDGPLALMGDLRVVEDGEVVSTAPRLTLCRCGRSRNQPFCDNSHLPGNFRSGPAKPPAREPAPPTADPREPVTIEPTRDGSLHVTGRIRIVTQEGETLADTDDVWLCRCGQSANKPFCDGSHRGAEFRSKPPAAPRERLEAESPAPFRPNPGVASPAQHAPDRIAPGRG